MDVDDGDSLLNVHPIIYQIVCQILKIIIHQIVHLSWAVHLNVHPIAYWIVHQLVQLTLHLIINQSWASLLARVVGGGVTFTKLELISTQL